MENLDVWGQPSLAKTGVKNPLLVGGADVAVWTLLGGVQGRDAVYAHGKVVQYLYESEAARESRWPYKNGATEVSSAVALSQPC